MYVAYVIINDLLTYLIITCKLHTILFIYIVIYIVIVILICIEILTQFFIIIITYTLLRKFLLEFPRTLIPSITV